MALVSIGPGARRVVVAMRRSTNNRDAFAAAMTAAGASWKRRIPAPSDERDCTIRSDRRLVVARSARASSQVVEDPK